MNLKDQSKDTSRKTMDDFCDWQTDQEIIEPQQLLIVDDDPGILSLLKDFFSSYGYPFRMAQNGLEAIKLLKKFDATIIITDLLMPNMDGIELIHEVKKTAPDTDIIVITGFTKQYRYTDVIKAGATDFIQKPFNLDELEAKLNRVIHERQLRAKLRHMTARDCLTNLFNRRYFDAKLIAEVERAIRQRYPLYICMLDLDKFKAVNDIYGHQTGDKVLQEFALLLENTTRRNVDIPCRLGGDEFAVIIPYATQEQAIAVAERILNNFQQMKNRYNTMVSIGLASLKHPESSIGFNSKDINKLTDALIQEADSALYAAKRSGGNTIIVSDLISRETGEPNRLTQEGKV